MANPIEQQPRHYGFLLTPNFPLMSYASAVEPLRAANLLTGRTLYTWRHVAATGRTIRASNGVDIVADSRIGDAIELDALFVCAGGNPALFREPPTLAWLRSLARDGVMVAGMSGGSYILARAGLLDGHRCTIHWEHIPALEEEFPRLEIRRTLFEIDRGRVTCAGGIASLDMMLALIERDHGPDLAAEISEWFLRTQPRLGSGSQRMTLRERHGVSNGKLLKALALMERRLEEPMPCAAIATDAGVSPRQLERLFADHLHTTPQAHYLAIRLDRAQSLLRQTPMAVAEIAVACGFVSTSHFSRAYRRRFARSPREDRHGAQSAG
ncbi:MAG TPA: GlxA family transcriptional regulator [Aliidongia sp.]|uniref:GlxA family transcriptional regulator n=1 Tax=Aliidongia sp. TaxID=1914230 RepID=UPI002DDD449C|nr:GlxA family transcriptional regulator [Aliidongia sp.]HEV2677421.1 GlxA family transcriptional regulator [Aliidongia sp.]